MHKLWYHVIFLMLCCGVLKTLQQDIKCSEGATTESCLDPIHTVLILENRDDKLADYIANSHGMYVKGRPFMESRYFIAPKNKDFYKMKRSSIYESIQKNSKVVSIASDYARIRVKRGYLHKNNLKLSNDPEYNDNLNIEKNNDNNLTIPLFQFNDPLYKKQWYLNGINNTGYDMNIREAWSMGYSGKGVTIVIVDDGLQTNHTDLEKNFDPTVSIDIIDGDDDPTPRNFFNFHGTNCAGVVSSVANNSECGVGVAYNSKIGGIRVLDLECSDASEAAAFSFNKNKIDIYSASWGPVDSGQIFDGPDSNLKQALIEGSKKGRNGKGNIFVWAGGNGGVKGDSCSADGYITSIYTLGISSVTYTNEKPDYTEKCPAIIASTYSSNGKSDSYIMSADSPKGCTTTFGHTSASAPMASGIIALVLEANPSLTWRDVQHITIRTANPIPLLNNTGWSINGVGRRISDSFGYGLMDAGALVKLAKIWKTVPEQNLCRYKYRMLESHPKSVYGKFQINFTLDANDCTDGKPVHYLEHVQVISTITYSKRGNLKLTLYSPKGTKSVILPPRSRDINATGIINWPFLTVQMWGEDPRGIWTLTVESITNDENTNGTIHDWDLLLYGTEEPAQLTDPTHSPVIILSDEDPKYQIYFDLAIKKLSEIYELIKKFLEFDN